MANEAQLKQKYQPAIDQMKQLGIHLEHVHMQGDKLYISGKAPNEDVKNRAWDKIKSIDSSYSDLTCDLTIDSSMPQPAQQQAPQTMSAGASVSGGQSRRYTVKPGDSLSKIAKQHYGSADQYMRIFEANRNILSDPNKIQPGQELVIPE